MRINVSLKTQHESAFLFQYNFVGTPETGDEIRENGAGTTYTIVKRFWDDGKPCLEVTAGPTPDKCLACGESTLLALADVFEFFPDEEGDPIEDEVRVGIHYCKSCKDIVDAWIETPI